MKNEHRLRFLFATLLCVSAVLCVGLNNPESLQAQSAKNNLTGVWDSEWAGLKSTLTLENVTPDHAVGTFKSEVKGGNIYAGGLGGKVKGDTFMGHWADAESSGKFKLTLTPDRKAFSGTWGTGSSNSNGGKWSARRQ